MESYQFRPAGFLEIPFIFNIIQEGCLTGSFSENLMTSAGYFTVLRTLFTEIALGWFATQRTSGLAIFTIGQAELGFMLVKASQAEGQPVQVIELCGIADQHRNQHHGSKMIQMYLATLQHNTCVVVYCTKFSTAMRHVLLRLKFKRDRKNVPVMKDNTIVYLESFSLTTHSTNCALGAQITPRETARFKLDVSSRYKAKP